MKKFILFLNCFFLLFTNEISSQVQDTTLARQFLATAMAKRDSAMYDQMIALSEQAGAIYKEKLGAKSLEYANTLHQKAIALRIKGKSKEAYQYWERAYKIRSEQLVDQSADMGWSYITLSRLLASESKYDTALAVIEKAVKFSKQIVDNFQLADALLAKAYILDSQGNPQIAVQLQKDALSLYKKYYPNNSLKIAYTTATIGITYNFIDREVSDEYILKALASYQEQLGAKNFWAGYCLFFLGINKQENYEIDEAIGYFKTAKEIFQEIVPTNHPMNIQSSMNFAFMLYYQGKKMKAIKAYEQIGANLKPSAPKYDYLIGKVYQNLGGIYHEVGNDLKAQSYFEKHLYTLEKTNGNSLDIATSKNNLVVSYFSTNQLEKAKKLLDEVAMYLEKCGDMISCESIKMFFYQNKAGYYEKIGIQEKAIDYNYKYALQSEKLRQPDNSRNAYVHLAHSYSRQEDYLTALTYMKKAETLNQQLEHKSNDILGDLGLIYLELEEYDKAEQYLNHCLELIAKENPENSRIATLYNNLGVLYLKTKRYKAAENIIKKGMERTIVVFGKKTPKITENYINLANLYIQKQDWTRAKSMLQKAEILLFPKEKAEKWVNQKEHILKGYFGFQHKLYAGLYKADNKIIYLDAIIANCQQAQEFEAYYTKSLNTDFAKSKTYERIYPYYLYAIAAYQEKIIQDPSKAEIYKNKIYELSEQGSQKLLRAKILNTNIETYADLPAKIIQQKIDLEQSILLLEKKIALGKEQDWVKPDSIQKLYQLLTNERINYASLMDTLIREEYPEYYNLKRNDEITSLETIQANLESGEVLLKYVIADTNIFLLAITPKAYEVKVIPKDSMLLHSLNTFPALLAKNIVGKEEEILFKTKYQSSATYLHRVLIEPIQHLLAKKLIIIPDGALYHLPFESLLVTQSKEDSPYSDWHFLLKDQQISYDFSATLYYGQQNKTVSKTRHNLLSIAPLFEGKDTLPIPQYRATRQSTTYAVLAPLRFNIPEARIIDSLFYGKLLDGAKATLANFLAIVSDYKIIHFATHAAANKKNGDYSHIYFSKQDSLTEYILYAKDLYGFKLDADMVVFSACETGGGELKDGAGIISLARGMMYAGARSVVASAWQVDDELTQALMIAFYQNLKDGFSKDEALQQAKLKFIQDYKSSPRYWAPFMAYGNMEVIDLENSFTGWWKYLLGFFVILGLIYLMKNKKII